MHKRTAHRVFGSTTLVDGNGVGNGGVGSAERNRSQRVAAGCRKLISACYTCSIRRNSGHCLQIVLINLAVVGGLLKLHRSDIADRGIIVGQVEVTAHIAPIGAPAVLD